MFSNRSHKSCGATSSPGNNSIRQTDGRQDFSRSGLARSFPGDGCLLGTGGGRDRPGDTLFNRCDAFGSLAEKINAGPTIAAPRPSASTPNCAASLARQLAGRRDPRVRRRDAIALFLQPFPLQGLPPLLSLCQELSRERAFPSAMYRSPVGCGGPCVAPIATASIPSRAMGWLKSELQPPKR
jgi:hypothetical protein